MAPYKAQQKHAPIDESVVVPAAIRAAAAKSDALHKLAYKTEDAPTQEQPNGKEAPKEPTAEKIEEAPKPKTPEPDNEANWEHRYNSMKGRNEANERALGDQGREITELRAQIQRLSAAPAPVQQPTADLTFKKITDEDRTNFGEDFIDVAKRAAAEVFQPEIERLKQQVTELGGTVQNVAKTTHDSQTLSMNDRLDREVPNWRDINRDPKFLSWVGLRDPYSGAIRMEMMREAHKQGDAQRVLNFFKGFLSDEATTAPLPNADLLKSKTDKVDLETLAAPGRAKASASDVPQDDPDDKEIITRAQVLEFYRLVNAGHYRGRDAEKDALERRIFQAQANGRIR